MKNVKNIKCNNCSANLSLDDNLRTLTCPYCGSVKYFEEDKSPNEELYKSKLTVESLTNSSYIPPRPKVHVLLAIVLFCSYFWPGVIYLCIINSQQKKWDNQYKNKK